MTTKAAASCVRERETIQDTCAGSYAHAHHNLVRAGNAMASSTQMFDLHEQTIVWLLYEGRTYEEISAYLTQQTGHRSGLSSRSLRCYCAARGIPNHGRVTQGRLGDIVRTSVAGYGHSYGRRMMHGMLTSQGIRVSQRRVGESFQRVAPIQYMLKRHNATSLLNPVPYRATYFGEKLHLDQNEKCSCLGLHMLWL